MSRKIFVETTNFALKEVSSKTSIKRIKDCQKFQPKMRPDKAQFSTRSIQKIKDQTLSSIDGVFIYDKKHHGPTKKVKIEHPNEQQQFTIQDLPAVSKLIFKVKKNKILKQTQILHKAKQIFKGFKNMTQQLRQFFSELREFIYQINASFSYPIKQILKSINNIDQNFSKKLNNIQDLDLINEKVNNISYKIQSDTESLRTFKLQTESESLKPFKLQHQYTSIKTLQLTRNQKNSKIQILEDLNIKKIQPKDIAKLQQNRKKYLIPKPDYFTARDSPYRKKSHTERISLRNHVPVRNKSVTQKLSNFNQAMQRIKMLMET